MFQKFFTIVDFSLKELCLLDELDNSRTVATLSSLIEPKQRNGKHNLPSFDKKDKDDLEIYLYADQDKFFLKFVLIKKIGLFATDSIQKDGSVLFYRGTRFSRDEYFKKLIESEFADEKIFTDEK